MFLINSVLKSILLFNNLEQAETKTKNIDLLPILKFFQVYISETLSGCKVK